MRAAFVFLLVAVVAATALWLWLGSSELPPGGVPAAGAPDSRQTDAVTRPVDAEPDAPPSTARAIPTRTAVEPPPPEDLADSPTACLQILDYEGDVPILGATIRRMKGGAVIGFTDERGLAELPLKEREQLCIGADGYLLRMAPTRLGSTPAEPQRLQLVRDRWSVRHRFELRAADGGAIGEAFVRITIDGKPEPPSDPDPVVNRARYEHQRLEELEDRWRGGASLVRDGDSLRFAAGIPYSLEFATTNGLARALRIDAATAGRTIRVDLEPGDFVQGSVAGDTGRALAGATLTRQGGDPLGLRCTTGADGSFSFGPLPAGELTLLVRHPDHEPLAFGPIRSDGEQVRIVLRELPRSTLRGRVRLRPDLTPIAGATVSWSATANPPITATTAEDGTFQLAATGDIAGRLLVSARGCVVLTEMVAPGAPFADYDLLPASTEDRLDKKLTAVLAGVVTDASGRPAAGVGVRWIPDDPPAGGVIPGRRAISGHVLMLPLTTTSGPDGSFSLETDRLGGGTLCLAGRDPADRGIRTEAIAGKTTLGLRLHQP